MCTGGLGVLGLAVVAEHPVLPDYEGDCVCNVVPALLRGTSPPWMPPAACGARQTVLLVLDGLGWDQLRAHAALAPTLSAMEGHAIRTVAPSTTATALTSIATGLTPAEHGVLGYRMYLHGDVLNRWWGYLDEELATNGAKQLPDAVATSRRVMAFPTTEEERRVRVFAELPDLDLGCSCARRLNLRDSVPNGLGWRRR